jgi:MinD superfamily P-loop ATPase
MKQLVILSGKGGTGKTSVAAALSHLASDSEEPMSIVMADADVDAANLELILAPGNTSKEDFWGGQVAEINQRRCAQCGECKRVCRFNAIRATDDGYMIDPIACEGCAACVYECPSDAISMKEQVAGAWFHSDSLYGPLFHAVLYPAQENSGKLVTLIKQRAKLHALDNGCELMIVDGPPGVGCPVISAISGADLALIVAEPSKAGVHDMRRILETSDHFNVPSVVCINKSDLSIEGSAEIESYCKDEGIAVVGIIPFDMNIPRAMAQGRTIIAFQPDGQASRALRAMWQRIVVLLRESDE